MELGEVSATGRTRKEVAETAAWLRLARDYYYARVVKIRGRLRICLTVSARSIPRTQ